MAEDNVFPLHAGKAPGCFSLAELPQRGSVTDRAFGSGWWELDEILRFYPGQFVVVTGLAGHGKSQFLFNVLLKMAREQGIKGFYYVPENEAYLYEKLKLIWQDDESFDYFAEHQCLIQSSIPEHYHEFFEDPAQTVNWILENAAVAVRDFKIEMVMIDPWNEIELAKPKDLLLTDYIGRCLRMFKQFCRQFNVTVIVVAHPTKAVNERGGRTPNLADIEGSMNWFNKCDNGLIVERHDTENSCRVISAKVREIGAGKKGECHFKVDPNTGIFTPTYGGVSFSRGNHAEEH